MWIPGASPKQKIHNSDMDGLAIIIRGNTATINVSTGDYVLVENSTISGISDGGYVAAANVSAGTQFTSANLTALSKGAVTKIGEDVNTLNGKMTQNRADATLNTTYVDSGSIRVYGIGNIRIVELSDIKFKTALPASSANNNVTLFTLPFTTTNSEIFMITKFDNSNPRVARLMIKDNVITPWWSGIEVTSGDGFFGIIVCKV